MYRYIGEERIGVFGHRPLVQLPMNGSFHTGPLYPINS